MTTATQHEPRCTMCGEREGDTNPFADYEQSRGDEVHTRCLKGAGYDNPAKQAAAKARPDYGTIREPVAGRPVGRVTMQDDHDAGDPFAGIVDVAINDGWDAS